MRASAGSQPAAGAGEPRPRRVQGSGQKVRWPRWGTWQSPKVDLALKAGAEASEKAWKHLWLQAKEMASATVLTAKNLKTKR